MIVRLSNISTILFYISFYFYLIWFLRPRYFILYNCSIAAMEYNQNFKFTVWKGVEKLKRKTNNNYNNEQIIYWTETGEKEKKINKKTAANSMIITIIMRNDSNYAHTLSITLHIVPRAIPCIAVVVVVDVFMVFINCTVKMNVMNMKAYCCSSGVQSLLYMFL